DPPRKPIGWNYQGTASKYIKDSPQKPISWYYKGSTSNNIKNMMSSKINGTVCGKQSDDNDEIMIVNETPILKTTTQSVVNKTPILKTTTQSVVNKTPILKSKTQSVVNKAPILKSTTQSVVNKTPVIKSTTQSVVNKTPILKSASQSVRGVSKVNGTVCEKQLEENDDIMIVDETPSVKSIHKKVVLPKSSSRQEIRKIVLNAKQHSIGNFICKSKQADTNSKRLNKTLVSKIPKNNNNPVSVIAKPEVTVNVKEKPSKLTEPVCKTSKLRETKCESPVSEVSVEKPKSPSLDVSTKSSLQTPDVTITKSPVTSSVKKDDEDKAPQQNTEDENSETSIAAVERFMSRWEELKSSKEDQKIRDKLWKHYYLAHSSFTHSKRFIGLLERSTNRLSIDNIYVLIKDLLDYLKRYKDQPYREKVKNEASSNNESPVPETPEERKRNRRLHKIEKKMKEISDKIRELEMQEIDLDDEDNSSYLIEDRLKRQFNKLHEYYCKVAECSSATGRPIEKKFRYTGSRYEEVNKRITAWVNKTKEFPSYVDILHLLKKVTCESMLPLRPETVRVQAQEIFRDVGRILKDRRESDDLYCIYSYVDDELPDPAATDEELAQKLNENESLAKENLDKVFQEFVDKEALERENADKNLKKEGITENDEGESNKSPVKEPQMEEKEDPSNDEEDADDEVNYDATEIDEDGNEEDEEEQEEDVCEFEPVSTKSDCNDLAEDTDDEEITNVIASASVEEDLSEE
ncbi:hypothetical protein SK128_018231, partial [Halocaridina rubra]